MDKLIQSEDGSHTVFSEKFGVTYHSTHGAIKESQVVYIDAGLEYVYANKKNNIKIFEMGFGTGLNALLSLQFAITHKTKINYTSIEAYCLQKEIYAHLNYCTLLDDITLYNDFLLLHEIVDQEKVSINDYFVFRKIIGRIEDSTMPKDIDVIYYDAFSPSEQAHLWEENIMQKMYNMLSHNGVLVTYCAKGSFKRTLKSCGFKVEGLPGPPGKREITRAIKI